jgi:hypothetical protein
MGYFSVDSVDTVDRFQILIINEHIYTHTHTRTQHIFSYIVFLYNNNAFTIISVLHMVDTSTAMAI